MAECDLISKTALLRHLDMAIDCKDCPRNADKELYKCVHNPTPERCTCSDIAQICIRITEFATFADVQPVKQWISVEDRLPDNDGWYLVYKFKQVRVAEWCESCWYNERDLPIDDVAISYWMPLPKPPNKT